MLSHHEDTFGERCCRTAALDHSQNAASRHMSEVHECVDIIVWAEAHGPPGNIDWKEIGKKSRYAIELRGDKNEDEDRDEDPDTDADADMDESNSLGGGTQSIPNGGAA